MNGNPTPAADTEDLLHLTPDELVCRAFVHDLRACLVESFWCDDDCNRATGDRRGERMMERHVVFGRMPSEMFVSIINLNEENALHGSNGLPKLLHQFLSRYAKVHKDATLSRQRGGYRIRYRSTQQVSLFEVD